MQLEELKEDKLKTEAQVESLTAKAQELKSKVSERKSECLQLAKEVKELEKSRVKLSSEVNGKEESLARLSDLGFLDEDLLRLRAIIENIAKENGVGQEMVKEEFFLTLGVFKDIIELKKRRTTEAQELGKLAGDRSVVIGEIAALEERRDTLKNEIKETSSSTIMEIKNTGEKAVAEIQQQAVAYKAGLDCLFSDVLTAGMAVGEMTAMVEKGENSRNSLVSFSREVKQRVEEKQ